MILAVKGTVEASVTVGVESPSLPQASMPVAMAIADSARLNGLLFMEGSWFCGFRKGTHKD